MIDYNTMNPTNKKVTFYDTHNIVKRWRINLYEDKHLLPSLVKLADDWKVKYNAIIEFIKANKLVGELFEYSTYHTTYSIMVAPKALFTEKKVREGYNYVNKRFEFDVYVKENQYITLIIPKIVEFIIKTYYPKFAIYKRERRFTDKIIINPNMSIDDISREYRNYKLTAKDISNLLTNPNYSTEYVNKLAYKLYGECDLIFYPLSPIIVKGDRYDMSLYIPREAIVNNDWSLVEKQFVHGIINPTANDMLGLGTNKWFCGEQKDAPYFNDEKIKIVKAHFAL